MNTKSSVQLFWSDHAWLPQEVIRIDDPGPRPFPRCFCSKKITVSTRGTLPCKEFRHKQCRLSPASRRGWRGGSWSFSKGECMNVCVRSLGQCVETASGAGAGQRSRHRCPGGREEWPRAPDDHSNIILWRLRQIPPQTLTRESAIGFPHRGRR